MSLFRFICRYYSSIKDESLKETWELSAQIAGTETVKYMVSGDQHKVIKKVANKEDFKNHISFYYKILRRRIKTPKIFSKDGKNLMIRYEAIGIESNENNVWTKTLVNFKYDPKKEKSNIDFLVRVIDYARAHNWTDLHSGNLLFDDGYLYLIDYVPGRGKHPIGSFGLEKIRKRAEEGEKVAIEEISNLKREKFDLLLAKAIDQFGRSKISYHGLEALRR